MLILLLGGTGSTARIALGLARMGHRVLVSRATAVELDVGVHAAIESRSGPLDERSLSELIQQRGIGVIVDATHPYATVIRATAARVAGRLGIPYLSFLRPGVVGAHEADVELAPDHAAAAAAAFAHGRPVLLTTGANHLAPYARESQRTGVPLVVRVLRRAESLAACRTAGIPSGRTIAARGPFSVAENRRQIRQFHIGVVVTKDSGAAGGTPEKLQAAREEGCRLIVVQRPAVSEEAVFSDVADLLRAVEGIHRG
ncbi:MAG: precorrin-6A reductase [Thermoguttaceae bacterium]|jgi:precorrin-6A/cobalt-precorrin-6A reductase